MTTVRCVVHPGWIEVTGPEVHAVVAAADRHAEALGAAAADGLLALLAALTAHGLAGAPDFAAAAPTATGLRVVVRGAAAVALPDGTRLGSQGRMPWADLDVDLADDVEVVLEAPEPPAPRGWRRPARLSRTDSAAAVAPPAVAPPAAAAPDDPGEDDPGRDNFDQLVDPVPTVDASGRKDLGSDDTGRDNFDQLVDLAPAVDASGRKDQGPDDAGRDNFDQLVEVVPGENASGAQEAPPEPDRTPEPGAEPEPEPTRDPAVPQPDLTLPPPADSVGLPPVARVSATPPPRGGLIDAVPWRRPGRSEERPETPDEAPPPPQQESPARPNPTEPIPATAPASAPMSRDDEPQDEPHHEPHDDAPPPPAERSETLEVPGATLVDQPASGATAPDLTTDRGALPRSEEDLDRPVVLAVLCPAGHPSPPHAGRCRTCRREIPPQQPFPTPRPSLGVLRLSTGGSVPLDRGVLLGRAPRVNEELPANQRPHLLRVGGPDRDISRNHAEVVLEGWHVLVRDLGSTNGTTVTLPGQEPVRLRPTEDQGIEPGTVVTLADEVVLTYEVEE